ncbi:MAG: sigma-54-dependent Fis family transcriptional regulator [Planctomycetales bacterium]|nr:sigma-54-dependent Fis family transcriptional regulator [Planctomycetales bacterium]
MQTSGYEIQAQSTEPVSVLSYLGSSPPMQRLYALIQRVAPSNAAVLLLGEIGTGKELVAAALHAMSERASEPFIQVNCGAHSEDSLECELFGFSCGAPGDTRPDNCGCLVAANRGTLFLDNIHCTTPRLQLKLLRVLQERQWARAGETTAAGFDTRVLTASHCDLAMEVQQGRFREELYWRLNVVPMHVPPLRKRREDIPQLVDHLVRFYNQQNQRQVSAIHDNALDALQSYHWPGNLRELQSYVERAVVMADGEALTLELLPEAVRGTSSKGGTAMVRGADLDTLIQEVVDQGVHAAEEAKTDIHGFIVNRIEKEVIAQVLAQCNFVKNKTAAKLGINRNTLHKKLKDYGLEDAEPNAD